MANEIKIIDVKKVAFVEVAEPEVLGDEEVLVETLISGLSAGTEMQFYLGIAPFFNKELDAHKNLFVKTETESYKYPLSYGYENVGKIAEVGKNVTNLKVGDVVASYFGHISKFKTKAEGFVILPESMDPRSGVFLPLLGVAYKNILNARIILGETVVIFGAGIVGQLLIQLAKLSGAGRVISVDMCDYRLDRAKESGADICLNPKKIADVANEIRSLTSNRGADVVFEATGSSIALHEAIRTVYRTGTVYATSFYRGEAKGLFLGEEFHHNAARIVMSGCIPNEVRPRWDEKRWQDALETTLPLLKLDHLISHEFAATDAQQAYETAAEKPDECLQIIFSY
ncbi:zinc-binding dehydrogenase [Paenibacillus sp. NRS-1760]|uniref:zinc-dependent alcohol dehydrogenase n=1 Tax=Paenibacillus sp. NRS-1760 TaxID=3233902 RepID=UPI003D2B85C0